MKNTRFLTSAFLLLFLFVFVTCQFQPDQPEKANAELAGAGSNREFLALLKARNNHTVSFEVLEEMVFGFINPEQSGGRSAAPVERTTIVKADKLSVIGEKRFAASARGRSAEDAEQEPVEVYSFITQKPGNENPGYVLASNDIRVGNFLAIVEEGSLDSEELAWFHDIVYEGIGSYIDRIIEEYDSISEEEVEQAVGRSVARKIENQTATGNIPWTKAPDYTGGYYKGIVSESIANQVKYVKFSYYWSNGAYAELPTEWDQGYPYNYVVNNLHNGIPNSDQYKAGCVPIAMGQIMAHHRRPASTNYYTYNWNNMVSSEKKYNINDPGAKDIAKLMRELGVRVNAQYHPVDGTGVPNNDIWRIITAFQNMGYNNTTPNSFTLYTPGNFPTLRASIQANRPVFIFGHATNGGHAWVIDAVRVMGYFEELYDINGKYLTAIAGPMTGRESQHSDWVHCNLGWGGSKNAWYASGIFNCGTDYQAHARSTIANYFDTGLQFLPNIY